MLVNDNMMDFSAFVLLSRALPDLRDGLKPVHRRILYSMKLNKTTKLTKSATVTGRIMEIHAHGDSYQSIVNLVQKDRQNIPFLEGKGSWGQFTSNRQGAAASRYTEVKLGSPALELMKELKNKSVDYIPNYDGTIMVPEVLPVTYPTILTQANSGIGVGFSSDTLSYNIHDIRNMIDDYLKTNEISSILIPDFSTGAYILDNETNHSAMENIMKNGRGSFSMRAKAHIEGNKIIVTEIPYGTKREQIMARIIKLNKDKKLPEVTDVRDGTSFTGMKIVITLRKNANPDKVLQKLYLSTPLQSNISANMNMLHNGMPMVLGVEEVVKEWTAWRKEVIVRGLRNDLNSMEEKLHLLNGMKKILIDIDRAIEIIRHSKNSESAIKSLCKEFGIDDIQAEHVANIRLINLNEDKINKQLLEIKGLEKDLSLLKINIKKDKFINEQLIKTMDESIKMIEAQPRKTQLIKVSQEDKKVMKTITKEATKVEDYECGVMLTKEGYLFKEKITTKQIIPALCKKLRLGDENNGIIHATNDQSVCVFLEGGKIGRIKVNDIDLESGLYIPNYLNENVASTSYIFTPQDNTYIVLGYADGQMVKIPAMNFDGVTKVLMRGYRKDSELIFIHELWVEDRVGAVRLQYDSLKNTKDIKMSDITTKDSRISKGRNYLKHKDGHTIKINLV